ncbi:hemin uptake protein HemP [Thiomicrorhabdus chilensis]|uniref:hemin uptake protein HemP n=1 Tax=Thiomicrorhabdus chilensis TaxID=63656 RepID=UPI0003FBAA3A|nr:hemin uptake protein HemP [Thiomicrorhabdus chilensis]
MKTTKPDSTPETVKVIDSRELLGEHNQIQIQHGQSLYQLRITRENKLILTK